MKVVVVGGTGNISTSIVRVLLEQGHDVTIVNRGRTAEPPADVETIVVDRQDREAFEEAIQSRRFDAAIDVIAFTPDDARSSIRAFRDVGQVVHTSTVTVLDERSTGCRSPKTTPRDPRCRMRPRRPMPNACCSRRITAVASPSRSCGRRRHTGPSGRCVRSASTVPGCTASAPANPSSRWATAALKVGDGRATHHLLHVDDAALGFVGALGKSRTIGQTYHLVHPTHTTWEEFHAALMRAAGREVEQVGVPADVLHAVDPQRFLFATSVFAHDMLFSAGKIQRDIPEFAPRVTVDEGLRQVVEHIDAHGLGRDADDLEDRLIVAQRGVVEAVRS